MSVYTEQTENSIDNEDTAASSDYPTVCECGQLLLSGRAKSGHANSCKHAKDDEGDQ